MSNKMKLICLKIWVLFSISLLIILNMIVINFAGYQRQQNIASRSIFLPNDIISTDSQNNHSAIIKLAESNKSGVSPIIINQIPGLRIENQIFYTSIVINKSPNAIIRNNTVKNVLSSNEPYGIQIIDSPNSIIENNRIFNLTSQGSAVGISVRYSKNTSVIHNSLHALDSDIDALGIHIYYSSNTKINNNTILNLVSEKDTKGIFVFGSQNITIRQNLINDITPGKKDWPGVGIMVWEVSNVVILNNSISNVKTKSGKGLGVVECKDVFIKFNNIDNVHFWISTDIIGENIICENNTIDGQLIQGCKVPGLTTLLNYYFPFHLIFVIIWILPIIRKYKRLNYSD